MKFCEIYFKLADGDNSDGVQVCLLSPCLSSKIYWGKWRVRVSDCNRWSLLILLLKYQISSHSQHRLWLSSAQERLDMYFLSTQVMENRYSLRLSPSKDARFDRIKINRSNFPRMLLQHYTLHNIEIFIYKDNEPTRGIFHSKQLCWRT